jgi:ParB family chromosome partitioning protein
MSKKARLGRGASALFSREGIDDLVGNKPAPVAETLRDLPVDQLQRGKYQPRTHMDQGALDELAASIRAQGVVQPIVVRPVGGGQYEIIAGERRWRAAQLAGLDKVPAVIRDVPDETAIAVSLIENIQRENLNPVEEAMALQRLADEFHLTHEETAASVGRSRSAVSNLLRLLSLNPNVRELLEDGTLDMGHGRALLALEGNAQSTAAREVVRRSLSVRETEEYVRRLVEGKKTSAKGKSKKLDPDVRALQDELGERLGAKVKIHQRARGKGGSLTIEFSNNDELDGILSHFR